MTPKQQRFIQEYLIDLNATRAAIRAGYSAKTAASIGEENLRKPEIAAAVEAKQCERAERTGISAQWVVDRLREIAERCMQAEQVADGSEYTFNAAGANKALELLGRHLGMFKDVREIRRPGEGK